MLQLFGSAMYLGGSLIFYLLLLLPLLFLVTMSVIYILVDSFRKWRDRRDLI